MEIKEAVAAVAAVDKPNCTHKPEEVDWKCQLAGATTGHLTDNIERDRKSEKKIRPTWPPPSGKESLAECRPAVFPHQAHHLIPWKQLENHRTSTLLAKTRPKLGQQIIHDAHYSVNHGNNGKFMPYASDLPEWKVASVVNKARIAEDLMNAVGIQLHQSRHSRTRYDGAEEGYKARVDEYLNRIHCSAWTHMELCNDCKAKRERKFWPPRAEVVAGVDGVSRLLEADIDQQKIFVSQRAALWALKKALGRRRR